MKRLIYLSIFLSRLTVLSFSQTQGEMNYTAGAAYTAADKELNSVYQSILKEYGKDTLFIKI